MLLSFEFLLIVSSGVRRKLLHDPDIVVCCRKYRRKAILEGISTQKLKWYIKSILKARGL